MRRDKHILKTTLSPPYPSPAIPPTQTVSSPPNPASTLLACPFSTSPSFLTYAYISKLKNSTKTTDSAYQTPRLLHQLPNSTIRRLHILRLISKTRSSGSATAISRVCTRIRRRAFMRAEPDVFVIDIVGLGVRFVSKACT